MTISRTSFAAAREFVGFFLDDPMFEAKSIFDATSRGVNGHIFRGQRSITHNLLPAAHRWPNRLRDYTPQPPVPPDQHWDGTTVRAKFMALAMWLHAELRAVHLFLEQADKLGLPTPIDYQALNAHQPAVDALFKEEDGAWLATFPEPSYLPAIAMAQHYAVPTRLLDWTESPLVAAYFAAVDASSALHGSDKSADEPFGVYMLDTDCLSKAGIKGKISLASAPRHGNPNLRAQRGLFVYMPCANETFFTTGRWPSVDETLAQCENRQNLRLFTLPASEADPLLRLLRRHEVSRHQLMPTLQHAAMAFQYHRALFN